MIIITCRPAFETSVLALRLGACDYVEKPFDFDNLRATVKRALTEDCLTVKQQRQWATEQLARARTWLAEVEQTWSSLTAREQQVLVRVTEGTTDATIAEELKISVKTVGRHVSSIFDKVGVHSRTKAAVWAMRAGCKPADGENSP